MAVQRETGACRSPQCAAAVRYLPNLDGRTEEVDFDATPDGPLVPIMRRGKRLVRERSAADGGRPGFTRHASTCADRGRARSIRPMGGVLGPCAGCGWRQHVRYGPRCVSTLCERCRQGRGFVHPLPVTSQE